MIKIAELFVSESYFLNYLIFIIIFMVIFFIFIFALGFKIRSIKLFFKCMLFP